MKQNKDSFMDNGVYGYVHKRLPLFLAKNLHQYLHLNQKKLRFHLQYQEPDPTI